jgi:hypothetical protein
MLNIRTWILEAYRAHIEGVAHSEVLTSSLDLVTLRGSQEIVAVGIVIPVRLMLNGTQPRVSRVAYHPIVLLRRSSLVVNGRLSVIREVWLSLLSDLRAELRWLIWVIVGGIWNRVCLDGVFGLIHLSQVLHEVFFIQDITAIVEADGILQLLLHVFNIIALHLALELLVEGWWEFRVSLGLLLGLWLRVHALISFAWPLRGLVFLLLRRVFIVEEAFLLWLFLVDLLENLAELLRERDFIVIILWRVVHEILVIQVLNELRVAREELVCAVLVVLEGVLDSVLVNHLGERDPWPDEL